MLDDGYKYNLDLKTCASLDLSVIRKESRFLDGLNPSGDEMHNAWIIFFLIEEGLALAQRSKESLSDNGGLPPNQNGCGTWVRNINGGVFTSPNFPSTYPSNKECVYILEALPRQRIQLAFDKNYYIEPSFECRFDNIEIRDGPFCFSPLINRFCGNKNPGLVTTTGRFMWIKFSSDEELEGLGFRIRYTFIAGRLLVVNVLKYICY